MRPFNDWGKTQEHLVRVSPGRPVQEERRFGPFIAHRALVPGRPGPAGVIQPAPDTVAFRPDELRRKKITLVGENRATRVGSRVRPDVIEFKAMKFESATNSVTVKY